MGGEKWIKLLARAKKEKKKVTFNYILGYEKLIEGERSR